MFAGEYSHVAKQYSNTSISLGFHEAFAPGSSLTRSLGVALGRTPRRLCSAYLEPRLSRSTGTLQGPPTIGLCVNVRVRVCKRLLTSGSAACLQRLVTVGLSFEPGYIDRSSFHVRIERRRLGSPLWIPGPHVWMIWTATLQRISPWRAG